MKYATATALRTALEARLAARGRDSGLAIGRLRKQVVFERVIARLAIAAPGRWVLKGGFALDLRLGVHARPTKDVDLGRQDNADNATADMIAIQNLDLGDYFQFIVERTAALDALVEGVALRYRVTASLAGRMFEQIVVDVGFGDASNAEPDVLAGPDLLEFADVEPPQIPTISLSQHVAEKIHAYSRTYGQISRPSTRVKDLVDLVLIGEYASLNAGDLGAALQATFDRRATHDVPSQLPEPPSGWRVPYARLAAEVGIDRDIATGFAAASAFLNPVLSGATRADAVWDPRRMSWVVA